MELQKQCGFEEFEDFLNRVLRLLLNNSLRDIPPLSESDFWILLRSENNKGLNPYTADSMEEDLADINNLIAKGKLLKKCVFYLILIFQILKLIKLWGEKKNFTMNIFFLEIADTCFYSFIFV